MKRFLPFVVVLSLAGLLGQTRPVDDTVKRPDTPFVWANIVIDTGGVPLAVYQLEFAAVPRDEASDEDDAGVATQRPDVRIVGIEGAPNDTSPAFADAPYYDPAAMQGDRVIIGAFSTRPAEELPAGEFTIATIHMQRLGDALPRFECRLVVCADADGKPIAGRLTVEPGAHP